MARGRGVTGAMRRRVFSTGRKRKVIGRIVSQSYAANFKRRRVDLGAFNAFASRVNNLTRMIETKNA